MRISELMIPTKFRSFFDPLCGPFLDRVAVNVTKKNKVAVTNSCCCH